MTARICAVPGCPALAVARGRCGACKLSEAQRGYGREHRRDRRTNRPGATCEMCGTTANLQRDHVVPVSMGGTEAPSNKRWLCANDHSRHGMRADRPVSDGPRGSYRHPGGLVAGQSGPNRHG